MPPKVTDTQPAADQNNAVEEETARAARRIVATYAEDFLDGVTLMSMLGVEPDGLVHKKVLAEQEDAAPKKTSKKSSKKATKKSSKKTTKKATKKSTKKSTKKTAKKASKKTTKKA
ncbi:TPA: hypothetical protein I8V91_000002 [Corynebacterium striatum]|uniref:hypothetical protein n=1 Tax=Corynebacterium TaxID=1716 RepID=UPI000781147B|nr:MULTISPECIES: hypothetical protein [Corynebacterium]AMO89518.1 putative histone H1 [Corynebacterium simulans]OFQ47704.1 hypothetical protein HMPREF2935_01890 [Corynebacterium sp. HMSC076D02]OFT36901.1 hypothetical protein HMPREF3169_00015 [Corynebacterium sp. HMSC08C04]OFT45893.1 hypothetical protein HMPREF3158_09045 [Corynebacterium sp. HMSC06G04]HAT1151306.1 hypothetical protein [Corynebacterium striatum]